MRVSARVVLQIGSVTTTAIALLLAACSTSGDPGGTSPAVSNPPPQPGVTGNEGEVDPTPSPSSGGACEDLGRLTGTSISAKLVSDVARSIVLPLANRPVPSRLSIIAIGSAADLTGKTVALGAAENANYETCTHCFLVALGCGTDCKSAALFYPRSGSATFTAVPSASGEAFEGTLTDVVLEEVKVDFSTNVSTKVEGGACLKVQELAFQAVAQSAGSPGAGGSDGGTGDDSGLPPEDGGTGSSGGTGKGGGGGDTGNLKDL